MVALAALDTLRGRQAPTTTHLAETASEPISRVLMMNPWVPVEVRVQERTKKEAGSSSLSPGSQAEAVQALHHAVVRANLVDPPSGNPRCVERLVAIRSRSVAWCAIRRRRRGIGAASRT